MSSQLKLFKVELQGDAMYFKAVDLGEAKEKMKRFMGGDIPDDLFAWTEIKKLPKGAEALI